MTSQIVAALGGNALLRRDEPPDAATQQRNVDVAVRALAELAREHELVVTYGNGPQVGLLALQSVAYHDVDPYPLDVLGAETEGMIGYLVEQGLENVLPDRRVATLLTQVVVDGRDPAFERPTKPIGPVYDATTTAILAHERRWSIARDGTGFRRVVASPEPREIVELDAIRVLVEAGTVVVCAGGGGIPVTRNGTLHGVEAVIDKDLAAALLAERLEADFLLLLTDVEAVETDWQTPNARPIREASPDELRTMVFAAGSMGPKIEAACRFVERTGRVAGIGSLADAREIVAGRRGTHPHSKGGTMNTILLATDGSPSAQNATSVAIELAAATGWHLKVVSVWSMRAMLVGEVPLDAWKQIEDAERDHAQSVVEEAIAAAKAQGADAEGAVLQGNAAPEICEAARDATLVVLGAHGWGSVKRLVFGSVSNSVLHHAPCPVLVVRGDLAVAPGVSRVAVSASE